MFNLSVSLGVPLLWGQGGLIARIVATVSPVSQQLEIGDAVSTITNFTTLTDANNYTPTADSAVIQVNGVDATGATVLADGDVVTLLVTAAGFPDFTFEIDNNVGAANLFIPSGSDRLITSDGDTFLHAGA